MVNWLPSGLRTFVENFIFRRDMTDEFQLSRTGSRRLKKSRAIDRENNRLRRGLVVRNADGSEIGR